MVSIYLLTQRRQSWSEEFPKVSAYFLEVSSEQERESGKNRYKERDTVVRF